ncbi:MAG: zinc ribbon domain-containing protein [Deltaproteobacteria bacterium]|nr:zinc ribbon domain-containing protein [Deltaproteobacteria bacterium]
MTLQNCHECGKAVSSEADKCPNCGAKVKKTILKKKVGCLIAVGILFLILLITVIVSEVSKEPSKKPSPITKMDTSEPKITARQHLKLAQSLVEKKDIVGASKHISFIKQSDAEYSDAKKLLEEIAEKEQAVKKEQEKRKKQALAKMRIKHDEIEKVTWYTDKSTPSSNNTNNMHLYIGKSISGHTYLRLKMQYASSNWLFIEKYIIKADNQIFEIMPLKVERDHYTTIWEWSDEPVGDNIYKIVQAVINSKKTVIRNEGTTYHKDRVISKAEKIAMKNVLDAYEALGGDD